MNDVSFPLARLGWTARYYTWATIPAAASYTGVVIRLTDVGQGGSYVIKGLTAPVTSDGTTTEAVIAQVAIPAGLYRTGDYLRVFSSFTKSGTADTHTSRWRFGTAGTTSDTVVNSVSQPATTTIQVGTHWALRAASNTSVTTASVLGGTGFGTSTTGPASVSSLNLASNTNYLSLTTDMTTGGIETATLIDFTVVHYTHGD